MNTLAHVEVLRAMRSVFDNIPKPCEERDALDAAIDSLAAHRGEVVGEVYESARDDHGQTEMRIDWAGDPPPAGTKLYAAHPPQAQAVDLEQFRPAVEALRREGEKRWQSDDGVTHLVLGPNHYRALDLLDVIDDAKAPSPQAQAGAGDATYTEEEVNEAMEVLRGRHGSTALVDEILDDMERVLRAALEAQREPE